MFVMMIVVDELRKRNREAGGTRFYASVCAHRRLESGD